MAQSASIDDPTRPPEALDERGVVRGLLYALTPLLLPVLAIVDGVVFAQTRWFIWLVVSFFLAFLAYHIVRHDRDPTQDHLEAVGEKVFKATPAEDHDHRLAAGVLGAALGSVVFIGIALLLTLILGSSPLFEGIAGNAAALARVALVVWGIALLARLFGFGDSILRLILAVTLILLGWRYLVYTGLLPWEHAIAQGPSKKMFIGAAVFALALCAGIEWAVRLEGEWGQKSGWRGRFSQRLAKLGTGSVGTRCKQGLGLLADRQSWAGFSRGRQIVEHARGTGVVASVLSALVLLAALAWGLHDTRAQSISLTEGRGVSPRLGLSSDLWPSALDDRKLAATFAPVLAFTEDERWRPSQVSSYLSVARVQPDPGNIAEPLTVAQLPTGCEFGSKPPCYQLTIECDTSDCARAEDPPARKGVPGVAYVRVLRKHPVGRVPTEEENFVFQYAGPPIFGEDENGAIQDIEVLVQYWLFYRYDDWSAATPFGRIVQQHEADWEAVTIGLSDRRPLFVAYSAHCGGSSENWENIEVAPNGSGLRPLVAVAEGSQANYDDSQDRRPPNWASCLGVSAAAVTPLTYIWGIEDVTGDDHRIPLQTLIPVTSSELPMSFPGTWGANDQTVLYNGREIRLAVGRGPLSPPLQPLWIDPISTIFCAETWSHRDCRAGFVRPRAERPLVEFLD